MEPVGSGVSLWRWFRQLDGWVRRLFVLSGLVAIVGAALVYIPTEYYVTAPGAAIDTSRLVKVEGGEYHRGRLYMLVVNTQPASLFWYLYAKLDHRAVLETREEYLGGYESYAEYVGASRRMMTESQRTARAIALQILGYGEGVRPVGGRSASIRSGRPVRGVLRAGDGITAVDGQPVASIEELRALLLGKPGGSPLTMTVLRQGKELVLTVPTAASTDPEREGSAFLGVTLEQELVFDDDAVGVTITSGPLFGPSAGLMFTLQIIDQLTPGGLLEDLMVAGTGTIEPDGRVGAIGAVEQKVYTAEAAGADAIFVPKGNYEAAQAAATRIEVVPVEHVRDALEWIRARSRVEDR